MTQSVDRLWVCLSICSMIRNLNPNFTSALNISKAEHLLALEGVVEDAVVDSGPGVDVLGPSNSLSSAAAELGADVACIASATISGLATGGDATILAIAAARPEACPGGVLCGVLCMVGVVVGVLVAGMAGDVDERLPMAAAATEAARSLTLGNGLGALVVGGSLGVDVGVLSAAVVSSVVLLPSTTWWYQPQVLEGEWYLWIIYILIKYT